MISFKKYLTLTALSASVLFASREARAEFLFNTFLTPSFDGQPNSEFSKWDVFYSPVTGINYPDAAAPNGTWTTASAAGFTPPANSLPSDPSAYWNSNNPTITQTQAGAFIIGPGSMGNIYSFSGSTSYVLQDSTPYTLGTVVLQFQTDGALANFDSIKLVYNNGSGNVSISASDMIREYRSSGSSFGGLTNRTSLQWDVSALGISDYSIVFDSSSASMSFQEALLDTSATSASVVPAQRTWNASGSGLWSQGSNWVQGSTSNANGNVRFTNSAATTVTLDGNRTVGEVIFDTDKNVTIVPSAGSILTANTGITTTAAASGTYTIQANYALGAFNVFDIENGKVVLNGVVSGNYGLDKMGAGTLVLAGNNTFTGGVGVEAGTLRLEGSNQYTGSTTVRGGNLVVAADAPASGAGALGNSSSAITLGADEDTTANVGAIPAAIWIEGDHSIARGIVMGQGDIEKGIGATQTTNGATYSGTIDMGSSGNVKLTAQNATDKLIFSGAINGGTSAKTVTLDGQGTVVFSGVDKTYASATQVSSGTLVVQSGTSLTGNGNVTVNSGAKLKIDGTLGGSGTLTLNGGTLTGSGTISRAFVADAGDVLSPGNSPGTLNTVSETWGGGATYLWEIKDVDAGAGTGWDLINITGSLNITAGASDKFTLQITSLDLANAAGMVGDFNALSNYSWILASASAGITGFNSSSFTLNKDNFLNALSGSFSLSQSGNNLILNYTAVPEPSTYLLLSFGLGLAAMAWFKQRKHKRN